MIIYVYDCIYVFNIINYRDLDLGLIRNDFCFGRIRRDCDEMMWIIIDFNLNIIMLKKFIEGVFVWIKIKVVNNGMV